MSTCHHCSRKLTAKQRPITIDSLLFCSDICRKQHFGKTDSEVKLERRDAKRSAFYKGLPMVIFGSLLLLLPLSMALILMKHGYFRTYDFLGIIYFIPGALILGIGLYTQKRG